MAVGSRDYYDALGVPRGASEEEIRRAYRRLARENHPDVNKDPGAEDRFKEVSEAYDVLRDPERRAAYDRFGENWRAAQEAGAAGAAPGAGSAGFRGGPPPRGGGFRGGPGGAGGGFGGFGDGTRVEFGEGGVGDLDEILEGLFGGGGGGGRGRRRGRRTAGFGTERGGDREATIELGVEEAFRGGKRHITLEDGRDYEVEIPPGVRDGQRIRLAGEGGAGLGGGPSGDLFLRVRIRPDKRFRLRGDDVEVDLPVAPWEAALGASVPVRTLEGTARVKVAPGSSSGRRLRLRGQGMPRPGGSRGDLYAVVKIMVPKELSREERELFERLAEVSTFNPREER
jgi:curved DNA-binding protein